MSIHKRRLTAHAGVLALRNPRRCLTPPAVAKSLRPWPGPLSTISGWALILFFYTPTGVGVQSSRTLSRQVECLQPLIGPRSYFQPLIRPGKRMIVRKGFCLSDASPLIHIVDDDPSVVQGIESQAMKAGAVGFLRKPFSDDVLVDLIRKALQGRRRPKACTGVNDAHGKGR